MQLSPILSVLIEEPFYSMMCVFGKTREIAMFGWFMIALRLGMSRIFLESRAWILGFAFCQADV
jgi:hypothetical protein